MLELILDLFNRHVRGRFSRAKGILASPIFEDHLDKYLKVARVIESNQERRSDIFTHRALCKYVKYDSTECYLEVIAFLIREDEIDLIKLIQLF